MSMPDESSRHERGARWAPTSLRTTGGAEYRVQPVPSASARINPAGVRGLSWDRLRVWRTYGDRYREAMDTMAGRSAQSPAHPGSIRNNRVDTLADLAAVHLYLTEERRNLDEALAEGVVGGHLSLARCVAAGLRRLPSFRGPATVRTTTVGPVTDWYRENRFVTEQGFWTASASAAALREDRPGFVVWSLTARLTGTVDPSVPDQLVFLPGTRFKVLRVIDGRRPLVLMRELFPPEQRTEGQESANATGKDSTWLDESTLDELELMTAGPRAASPSMMSVRSTVACPWDRPPGLIVMSRTGTETTAS
ncbi:MAG: hypothetical protein JF597_06135 [Streptomyces sp.]|uniref:hypothetical protein n=1 Tax=Streptomyces sp. TaxID=1931 RepID=UPI0026004A87|nr:hypothetical protein [Streptomyces sp.]MBW8793168.1 hypothetical protein [Streptomyces sp.]